MLALLVYFGGLLRPSPEQTPDFSGQSIFPPQQPYLAMPGRLAAAAGGAGAASLQPLALILEG